MIHKEHIEYFESRNPGGSRVARHYDAAIRALRVQDTNQVELAELKQENERLKHENSVHIDHYGVMRSDAERAAAENERLNAHMTTMGGGLRNAQADNEALRQQLAALREAALDVVAYDWSDNNEEPVADMERLRMLANTEAPAARDRDPNDSVGLAKSLEDERPVAPAARETFDAEAVRALLKLLRLERVLLRPEIATAYLAVSDSENKP